MTLALSLDSTTTFSNPAVQNSFDEAYETSDFEDEEGIGADADDDSSVATGGGGRRKRKQPPPAAAAADKQARQKLENAFRRCDVIVDL